MGSGPSQAREKHLRETPSSRTGRLGTGDRTEKSRWPQALLLWVSQSGPKGAVRTDHSERKHQGSGSLPRHGEPHGQFSRPPDAVTMATKQGARGQDVPEKTEPLTWTHTGV